MLRHMLPAILIPAILVAPAGWAAAQDNGGEPAAVTAAPEGATQGISESVPEGVPDNAPEAPAASLREETQEGPDFVPQAGIPEAEEAPEGAWTAGPEATDPAAVGPEAAGAAGETAVASRAPEVAPVVAPEVAAQTAARPPLPAVAVARTARAMRVVGVVLATSQVLLWDVDRGEYALRRLGEEFAGARIVSVKPDRVMMARADGLIALSLSPPPTLATLGMHAPKRMPAMVVLAAPLSALEPPAAPPPLAPAAPEALPEPASAGAPAHQPPAPSTTLSATPSATPGATPWVTSPATLSEQPGADDGIDEGPPPEMLRGGAPPSHSPSAAPRGPTPAPAVAWPTAAAPGLPTAPAPALATADAVQAATPSPPSPPSPPPSLPAANQRHQAAAQQPASGAPRALRRADLDAELQDFGALAEKISLTPAGGGGYSIARLQPGSLFARVGLRTGDVVRGVNGVALRSIEDAAIAYAAVRASDQLTVHIERGGRPGVLRLGLVE